jgi:hypothetical protein
LYHINFDNSIEILLNTAVAVFIFSCHSGVLFIASINLSSQNICSFQSFSGLLIASVIQSLYKTIISFFSNFISFSFIIFEISLIIHRAIQPDLILYVFFSLYL